MLTLLAVITGVSLGAWIYHAGQRNKSPFPDVKWPTFRRAPVTEKKEERLPTERA